MYMYFFVEDNLYSSQDEEEEAPLPTVSQPAPSSSLSPATSKSKSSKRGSSSQKKVVTFAAIAPQLPALVSTYIMYMHKVLYICLNCHKILIVCMCVHIFSKG